MIRNVEMIQNWVQFLSTSWETRPKMHRLICLQCYHSANVCPRSLSQLVCCWYIESYRFLYLATSLKVLFISINFLVECPILQNRNNSTISFLMYIPLISFSCLNALASAPSTMSKVGWESEHAYLIPSFSRHALSLSPLRI